MREIDVLLGANPRAGSEEVERLEFLALLVSDYESRTLDMGEDLSAPQDVVDFMLEQKGFTRGDLAEWLGGRSRVSDFLSRKRELSRRQILVLRERLGIPADLLIG
ncbi:MAG TPA: transcriptional regulator [Candidatus Kapabacteria bacterium]|nr:transcriptional regulator [Candidatus Kapabacteria bacterium]